MDLGIKNKVALVTAASQGLGKASAIELANEGVKLAICSRDQDKINQTAEEIQNLSGAEVLAVKADLDSTDDIENLIKEIENKFNTVDILVNNTGGPKAGFFDDLSDEDWLKTFESTFLSAVRITRKVLPFMKKNKWGRIINISSVSAKQPIDNLMLSNGVRMSIHGWAKTLSNQVASENILINNVCPGFTHTEFHDQMGDFKSSIPSFMWMDSKTVAEQAFNETMKGKDLFINGGVNKFLAFLMWLTPKWLTDLYYALIMRKRP